MRAKTLTIATLAALALSACGVITYNADTSTSAAPTGKPDSGSTVTATPAPVAPEPVSPVRYEVVEENDISYANCRRVAYKIKVADSTSSESVDATQEQIIDENKSTWDDITVWTYNESDTDDYVRNSAFTVDMAEYSTCQ